MDKISLLNHSVGVLCDNVRQNATKVILSFCKAPPQAERDVGARATKSRRGRLSMITWMSFQSCDKFELCDAVNLLTLWFGQSIGDYVVPDWHTEF